MAKAQTLQQRLALSLDQANRSAKTARPAAPVVNQAEARCTKISISLFSGDVERLDAIRDYMAAQGVRISTSQAVKLALRTAELSPDMIAALDAIRAEDGRKW